MTDTMSQFQEALFKTLAVMTNADTNVSPVEVEMVQSIFKDTTGIDVDAKAVHTEARSEFLEDRTIQKYLAGVENKLNQGDKKTIMQSLAKLIKADDDTRPRETAMFNDIAKALNVPASDLADI